MTTNLTEHLKAATAERATDPDVTANRRAVAAQRNAGVGGRTTLGDAIEANHRAGLREAVDEAETALKGAKRERRRLKREGASPAELSAADEAVADAEAAVSDAARQRSAARR